ncbi:MAG: hypothetical protein AAFQ89_03085 [Cyanobacteria bacterium J06626_18]
MRFRIEEGLEGTERKIELFVPSNPYFTTYQVSEEVYQLIQAIQRLQPQWHTFVTPANQTYLTDLICKGLLRLSPERSLVLKREKLEQLFHEPSRAEGIVEMWTKTTPTCLSAYLNQ